MIAKQTKKRCLVSNRNLRTSRGFTLIELMIVVAVMGILLALVVPSYSESVRKSRRADAMKELMELGARQERFYAQNSTYTTDIDTSAGLGLTRTVTAEGYYSLTSEACAGKTILTCYLLKAVPVASRSQAEDSKCATLSLNRLGERKATGTQGDKCW